uniref:Carboxylic ester hydrolase n=2 Tax=Arcella intermedia TaxID=1963864 RepID=A0A6B2L1Q6_9EUKA
MVVWLVLVVVGFGQGDPTVVMTTNGPIQGQVNKNTLVWSGVPFAAPPVGANRLRPPQPVQPWTDVKQCTHEGNVCPQVDLDGIVFYGDEDCLNLDVYVPITVNQTGLLPVMVWFYGGGWTFGDKYEFGLYDATALVESQQHIHVAPNYRLNGLGFLALSELMSEGHTTGNYGLLDQLAALQWVQQNIKAFGGDPNQVTIFGESAGAFSVCWHLVNPASAGLFRAAIMESGTCDSPDFFTPLDQAYAWGYEYAAMLGCNDRSNILNCLRAVPTETFLNLNFPSTPANAPRLYPLMPWAAVIDGVALPGLPLDLIKAGKFQKVPLVVGTNHDEGDIFLFAFAAAFPNVSLPITEEVLRTLLHRFFNDSATELIIAEYQDQPTWEVACSLILRDFFFGCSARRIAAAFSKFGGASPAYLYHFTFDPDWIDYKILGQYHSSEIEFVFNNPWPPLVHEFDANCKTMAAAMGKYWDNLARFKNPNGDGSSGLPKWSVYDPSTEPIVRLDVPVVPENDYLGGVCDFWDKIQEASN